jgi:hypothetical protein
MKKSLKEILNELSEAEEKNWKLHKEKEWLEKRILEINIKIYTLADEYNKLCKKFLKEKK